MAALKLPYNFHFARNDAQAGFYGFSQHDNQSFGLLFNDGSNANFQENGISPWEASNRFSSTTNSRQPPGSP